MQFPSCDALNAFVYVLPLLLLSGAPCGQFFPGPDDGASVAIGLVDTRVQTENTQQLPAGGATGVGDTEDMTSLVKWSSSSPAIGTVETAGLAKGIANGTVAISETHQCFTVQTSLFVSNQAVAINPIAVRPQNLMATASLAQQFVKLSTSAGFPARRISRIGR